MRLAPVALERRFARQARVEPRGECVETQSVVGDGNDDVVDPLITLQADTIVAAFDHQ